LPYLLTNHCTIFTQLLSFTHLLTFFLTIPSLTNLTTHYTFHFLNYSISLPFFTFLSFCTYLLTYLTFLLVLPLSLIYYSLYLLKLSNYQTICAYLFLTFAFAFTLTSFNLCIAYLLTYLLTHSILFTLPLCNTLNLTLSNILYLLYFNFYIITLSLTYLLTLSLFTLYTFL
jgi:hypothetical protein